MTLPIVDPYYRVTVTAGARSWSTTKGDAAGYGLADPVRVSWQLPNQPLFHAQPDPMVAAFSVVVASMADVTGLDRGDPVDLRVYGWPPGTANPYAEASDLDPVNYPPIVLFRGRVAEINAAPHALGMIVTYSCVDYTVDLSELTIGAGDWPVETNDERLTRMFSEAGVLPPAPLYIGGDGPHYFLAGFNVRDRNASAQAARAAIWRLVDIVTDDADVPFGTYHYMRPHYAAGLLTGSTPDPLQPFDVPYAQNRKESGDATKAKRLPGKLALTTATKYGVRIVEEALRRAHVIKASAVDFKAQWAQTKQTAPDTVTVTGTFLDPYTGEVVNAVTAAAPGAIPIGASLPCDGFDITTARQYAAANLHSEDSDHWTADAFTWYADQDPWPLIADALWFVEGKHAEASRAPVVLTGIPTAQNPTGVDWYAGRLRSAAFTLADGHYSVTFQLARSLLRPQVNDPIGTPLEGTGTLSYAAMWPNVLPNPDFEVDASGWVGTNAAVARSTAQKRSGKASLLVTSAAAGNAAGRTNAVPATAGKTYYAEAYTRAFATVRNTQVVLAFYDATSTLLASTGGTAVANTTAGFTKASHTAVAPAGTTQLLVYVYEIATAAGEKFYVDDVIAGPRLTYQDLDPAFSHFDYRLVRSP